MLIETWVAVMIILSVFLLSLIGLCGWIIDGKRLEVSNRKINKLTKENEQLRKENAKLNTLLNIKVTTLIDKGGEQNV